MGSCGVFPDHVKVRRELTWFAGAGLRASEDHLGEGHAWLSGLALAGGGPGTSDHLVEEAMQAMRARGREPAEKKMQGLAQRGRAGRPGWLALTRDLGLGQQGLLEPSDMGLRWA